MCLSVLFKLFDVSAVRARGTRFEKHFALSLSPLIGSYLGNAIIILASVNVYTALYPRHLLTLRYREYIN